ncbi:RagB/SusD family nutrient uptake outer membrane protein [Chitinophaga filiformis]|uniref:RagB/SusD family nutrient uptake outer membrane protein n=1 Tax=Chitinophaga filiformis TaxID=104663 RepID=A0ABY4HXY8_CHIFI|nr:RagB/SusD family nutrient uptake outer membrane protein [Chitinophaga filiformis]UPK68004.1 RagB/SusD family nutrient uptake outer membrane protein [Chitinophaga filiformis]
MKSVINNKFSKANFSFTAFALILSGSLLLHSCKKLIEVDLPINRNTNETVFANTSTAVAAMNSIYSSIGAISPFVGNSGISIRSAVMADELSSIIPETDPEYLNNYTGSEGWNIWLMAYKEPIYRINSILENISRSTTLPNRTKQIVTGEAKFCRAWLYFYLVNLYGDIPLVLGTDFNINSSIARSPIEVVYQQIEKDLVDAQQLLVEGYLDKDLVTSTNERIRPNKAAATALLARVYLYREKWQQAETEATKVISNGNFELLPDPDQVFLKNSTESIWQLQPNILDGDGQNTPDGRFLINPYGGAPLYYISSQLLAAFEPNDQRQNKWIILSPSGIVIPYKYKEGWATTEQKEYTTVLRIAEQYLIRAEARAQQNKLTGSNSAETDLNAIRNRAGLPNTTAITQSDLLTAIAKERQVELFLEWGDRWFNLKRTGKINDVMSIVTPLKGGTWIPYKALLPIPYEEFNYNPALRGHQNPGYQEQP